MPRMALPLFLVKLYWVGKVLKYPFAALVDTVREYRGRDLQRPATAAEARLVPLRIRERTFFQNPVRALRDRRFWVRGVTNSAEMLMHILALWAWGRNAFLRRTRAAFLVWNPHRAHEHHLFDEVEYARWGRVIRRALTWTGAGFRIWHGPRRPTLLAGRHGWHANWREVHFDGADVAVYVGPRRWRRPLREFRRRGGERILRVQSIGPRRARATLMNDAGDVLQTVTLGPAGD